MDATKHTALLDNSIDQPSAFANMTWEDREVMKQKLLEKRARVGKRLQESNTTKKKPTVVRRPYKKRAKKFVKPEAPASQALVLASSMPVKSRGRRKPTKYKPRRRVVPPMSASVAVSIKSDNTAFARMVIRMGVYTKRQNEYYRTLKRRKFIESLQQTEYDGECEQTTPIMPCDDVTKEKSHVIIM